MRPTLSPNTQAILLLTAPLIAGRGPLSHDLLSPGEYKRLARHFREMQRQPADLLSPDAADVLRACQPVVEESRLQRLLGRGFLLSQAIERWQARAIWVVSRADADYPRRLKARLREDAPGVLYGCGDIRLLATGGLAVVGSRDADETLIDYTIAVGRLAARAGKTIVSGGAKGIDQSAMRGALEAGGEAIGVLADSLERASMNRDHRNLLIDGKLVLISPYDPGAGFNVGNAMQRNKLIYALADASLVVSSDLNKGGTWAGATEQLNKYRQTPIYVRSTGKTSVGLEALRKNGAIPWPDPLNVDDFELVFRVVVPPLPPVEETKLSLFSNDEDSVSALKTTTPKMQDSQSEMYTAKETSMSCVEALKNQQILQEKIPTAIQEPEGKGKQESNRSVVKTELCVAETLFSTVRELIQQLLQEPMKDTEVASALGVSTPQAKAWLQRLVDERVIRKRTKPITYQVNTEMSFLPQLGITNRSSGRAKERR